MIVKEITKEEDLKKAFDIRKAVFVEEQHVPLEDEFDQFDHLQSSCRHVLVLHEQIPVGTGRIRWLGQVGKLERICILKSARSLGFGKAIIQALENIAIEEQTTEVILHGQTHAETFYKQLGYERTSDVFIEDGIPHLVMRKQLS